MLVDPPYRQALIVVLTVAVLAAFGLFARKAAVTSHGWYRLKPSRLHWFGLIFGSGMLILLTYIRLFVGSSRSDAERQMLILTGLIVALVAGILIMARSVVELRKLRVEWRGNTLSYRENGQRRVRDISDLVSVGSSWRGALILAFSDGECLRFDEEAQGVPQMLDWIAEGRPDLFDEEDDG